MRIGRYDIFTVDTRPNMITGMRIDGVPIPSYLRPEDTTGLTTEAQIDDRLKCICAAMAIDIKALLIDIERKP